MQAIADRRLVAIVRGAVDVPVAGLQSCRHGFVGGEFIGLKGAQADERDAIAGVQESSGLLVNLRTANGVTQTGESVRRTRRAPSLTQIPTLNVFHHT